MTDHTAAVTGVDGTEVLARLHELQADDLPTHGGRTLAYVYDAGLAEVDEIGRQAVATFAATNGLDPTSFPSMLRMENDLVGIAADLLDATPEAVGSVTSGGTESVLLAVQAARDARPEVARPRMVLPSTIHAAFLKAAHYFGVEAVVVDVGPDFRADVAATAAAVDAAPDDTVLVAVSAPSYAHGVVDPVEEIAAHAAARGIRCHVDACIGGWVLPYAARVGRPVRPWTFAVEGVTSISVDLHKYGYSPKGASLLLHRTPALRRPQYFARADWPGYTMLNSTLQSTKSGGPLAAAWAVVRAIGEDGYRELTRRTFDGMDALVHGIDALDGVEVLVAPDSTLLAFTTDGSCDVFTISDEMKQRGWYVQPQMAFGGSPANVHLTLSAATAPLVPEFLDALAASVAAARAVGPVTVDPGIADYLDALDPDALTDDDFDGLLAAAGLIGGGEGLALPARMAEVNAMLDHARPRLREALLVAFLDRLQRPVRA